MYTYLTLVDQDENCFWGAHLKGIDDETSQALAENIWNGETSSVFAKSFEDFDIVEEYPIAYAYLYLCEDKADEQSDNGSEANDKDESVLRVFSTVIRH